MENPEMWAVGSGLVNERLVYTLSVDCWLGVFSRHAPTKNGGKGLKKD